MYLYIHGFGGNGLGVKASMFREHFNGEVIAPSLSYVPDLAIDTLTQIVECMIDHTDLTLVGSSLGGYYATYLSEKYGLKAVLINPSTKPYITLQKVLSQGYNYYDGSSFDWNEEHIKMLKKYDTQSITPSEYLILLQTADELLDYREAVKKYEGANMMIEEGGSHTYDHFESKYDDIANFAHRMGQM